MKIDPEPAGPSARGLLTQCRVELLEAPSPGILEKLVGGLLQFNESKGGPRNAQTILVVASNPDSGDEVGGLYGATVYNQLKIEILYLPESMRGQGIGRKIIQVAEAEAERRGCHAARLETFSFQAREFYERLGYSVFGSYDDFPAGHTLYFMEKSLQPKPAT
jgi:GNAT superfamily N-acetyltransferase